MRLFIIVISAVALVSCASGGSAMKYTYLPESNYHYYKPLKPVDLKQKRFKIVETRRKGLDTNNFLYAFESSWDYDPEPNLGKIMAKLLALNFTDDMINAVEIDVMDRAVAKIPNGRAITMATGNQKFGHLNQAHPEIWKHHLVELLNSLP